LESVVQFGSGKTNNWTTNYQILGSDYIGIATTEHYGEVTSTNLFGAGNVLDSDLVVTFKIGTYGGTDGQNGTFAVALLDSLGTTLSIGTGVTNLTGSSESYVQGPTITVNKPVNPENISSIKVYLSDVGSVTTSTYIRLQELTLTYTTIVSGPTLSGIAVTQEPTNKVYYDGEEFDPTGIEITATYSDSSTAVVTSEVTYSPSPLVVGTTSVLVSYLDKTTSVTGITVNPIVVTSITLDKTDVELLIGQTNQLTATIAPTNATDKSVTWSSSDETKVTVSTAGLLTAVAPTSSPVTVTVTTTDGGFTDSVLVTVIEDLFVLVNSSTFNGTGSANWPTATGMGAYFTSGYGVASASAGATVKAPLLLKDIVVGSQVRVEIASVTNSATNTTNVSVYGLDYMGERISGISGSYTNLNNGGGTVNLDTLTARALANEGVIVLPVSLTTKIYGVEVVFESADSRSLLAQIEVFSLAASDADQAAAFANLVNSDVGAGANGSCPAILAVLQNDYSLLSVGAKAVVDSSTDAAFVSARARIAYLEAWVTANPGATANPLDLSSNTPITLIIGILGLTAVAGFYLVSKKRYNN
jgi:hypothetical protein